MLWASLAMCMEHVAHLQVRVSPLSSPHSSLVELHLSQEGQWWSGARLMLDLRFQGGESPRLLLTPLSNPF